MESLFLILLVAMISLFGYLQLQQGVVRTTGMFLEEDEIESP